MNNNRYQPENRGQQTGRLNSSSRSERRTRNLNTRSSAGNREVLYQSSYSQALNTKRKSISNAQPRERQIYNRSTAPISNEGNPLARPSTGSFVPQSQRKLEEIQKQAALKKSSNTGRIGTVDTGKNNTGSFRNEEVSQVDIQSFQRTNRRYAARNSNPDKGDNLRTQRNQRNSQRGAHAKASDVGTAHVANSMWSKENQTSRFSQKNNTPSLGLGLTQKTQSESVPRATKKISANSFNGVKDFFNRGGIRIVGAIFIVLLLIGGIDALANGNKIYAGVKVGAVDVGGLTVEQAETSIQAVYGTRFANNEAVFFKDEDAFNNPQESDTDGISEEDISYDEAVSNRTQWTVTANTVGATFDVSEYAQAAYEVGRSDGGLFSRIGAFVLGNNIEPEITVNEQSLDTLHIMFTESIGTIRVNYDIEMVDEVAQVTEGHDGDEVTSEWILERLNDTLMHSDQSNNYVLETTHLSIEVDENAAQECADKVNDSIANGALFVYGDSQFEASRGVLAEWITTEVKKGTFGNSLKPIFNEDIAKSSLLSNLSSTIDKSTLEISFEVEDETVKVLSNAQGQVPAVSNAIEEMNESFFKNGTLKETPQISLTTHELPQEMSFQDALDMGLISEVSSYTTSYASGAKARNHNIHTAADLLSYSIAPANGGVWSFNETAGEATVEKGYQDAHAIVSGELTDSIGGGICQVATTVFNAVYDAGYPVVERRNHTLYIASYPAGRDAAIAYPDYDLRWKNDTPSDVLLIMSYTDTTVTCTLYGVDPEYEVSTETGDFKEGKKYVTEYRIDEDLASGVQYVETSGVDGCSISVVRTVKDKDGNVLHEDLFESVYQPQNEVIVRGGE